MSIVYHYPPELLNLLVDTIPLLCRSKMDTVIFFKGAGVSDSILSDIEQQVTFNKESTNKYEIARTILTRINEKGEATLRERREILKRICEFESFSNCWPNDQLKAKGLVSEIRRVTNVKDSFTRIKQEREKEKEKSRKEFEEKKKKLQKKKEDIKNVKDNLFSLFNTSLTPQQRGKQLEVVLNDLFKVFGILVRESFVLVNIEGEGVSEQVDGVIEIDGNLYFVEMKWTKDPIDVDPVSRHLIRVYHRGYSRAIFISAADYTQPAIAVCKEALQKTVVTLCNLHEIVNLLEKENDLYDFFKKKIQYSVIDKDPYRTILDQ